MEFKTEIISEEILKGSETIITVLNELHDKLPLFCESFDKDNEDFLENDKLIQLCNTQRYQILFLQEKYTSALKDIAQIEEERDDLNQKILNHQTNELVERNNNKIITVPLAEYDKLKEEFLKLFSMNQSYEEKHKEYDSIIHSYKKAKETLSLLTYSHEELKAIHYSQIKEYNKRIECLNKENAEIKEEIKDVTKKCSLFELEKKNTKSKVNKINQRSNTVIIKMKTMEKANTYLKRHCNNLKTKLTKTKDDNEIKIDELSHHIEELEEKNIHLTEENRKMSKNVFKDFIEEIEKENIYFHYNQKDNLIAVYYDNEMIGEVKNMSNNSIERNHSNKIKDKSNYRLSDCIDIDKVFLMNSLHKANNTKDVVTLKQLYSPTSHTNSRESKSKSNSSNNNLNLLSWYAEKEMVFTNTLRKLSKQSSGYFKEITPFDQNIHFESENEEEEKIWETTLCNGESFTLLSQCNLINKSNNSNYIQDTTFQESIWHYHSNNLIKINDNHLEKGTINQVIINKNLTGKNCFYCSIY